LTDSRVSHEGLEVVQGSTTVTSVLTHLGLEAIQDSDTLLSSLTHLGLEVIMKFGVQASGADGYWS